MIKADTAVIGAGPAGIVAAISAKRRGRRVVICEKMPRPGKKLLASGNGRCNLLNEELDESFYNPSSRPLVKNILSRFGKTRIKDFFAELGLILYSEKGRFFPVTNQSASVLKILEMELARLSIPVELDFEVSKISPSPEGFSIASKSGKRICSNSLIIAGGGMAYPALGSDGGAYRFAEEFGHTIVKPVPAAVPLVVKDAMCHSLQGQKIFARAKSVVDGKITGEAYGELLFTRYGLSGTCILDISEEISIALNRLAKKDVYVSIDMAPFMDKDSLDAELKNRSAKGFKKEDLIAGILPNKFHAALKDLLRAADTVSIADALKNRRFDVSGTRGWNEADFTAGGVSVSEIKEDTLESKLKERLYFAGEILDVNGRRGGYNLAWGWASGFVAGMSQ